METCCDSYIRHNKRKDIMTKQTELKKEIAKRNAREISNNIHSVISKYRMTETAKDELLQIADKALCLKTKIGDI